MARKNIFQLIEENYNIYEEANKLGFMFGNQKYFEVSKNCMGTLSHVQDMTLWNLIGGYFFNNWKYRFSCLNIHEYLEALKIDIDHFEDEDTIINFLEVLENFIDMANNHIDEIADDLFVIAPYDTFKSEFCRNVDILEKRMGLVKRKYKDRIILYPKNAPLEKIVDLCEDDASWELIQYARGDMDLGQKRKSLAYFATVLYIEQDSSELDLRIKDLMTEATNLLNNLHIRHNNKTGKWASETLQNTSEEDATVLCDMLFNDMLMIILLRESKKYMKIYDLFNQKQKEEARDNKRKKPNLM